MKIYGEEKRALWFEQDSVKFIDQRYLPYKLKIFSAKTVNELAFAIKNMVVRGAPAIGATAAYGMAIGKNNLKETSEIIKKTRPTAHDLFFAVDYMIHSIKKGEDPILSANSYVEDIINRCKMIGEYGEKLIKNKMKILTHCNAGALATVDYGTALSPLRFAHRNGKNIFIFVDETRPRLQGLLTSWELKQEGIDHAVIADNASGFFMKKGEIDMVIVGADRIAKNGDFANKIGTYEKAVIAKENKIPFFVAAPMNTFDKKIKNGKQIIIEERDKNEMTHINHNHIIPSWVKIKNPAFDVTPSKYVTGFITENGIIEKLS